MLQLKRDWRDIISGLLMIAIGLSWAIWAQTHYRLGTATRMGPGWFPMYLGYALAIVGVIITIPACFRKGELAPVDWKPAIWLTVSTLAFSLVRDIGMVPAVILQVGLCILADRQMGWIGNIALALVTATFCHFVFYVGLDVQLPPFGWPFQ